MKLVRLIIAGGTIAMTGSPAHPSTEVVEMLGEFASDGGLETEVFAAMPSVHFSKARALALCQRIIEVTHSGQPVVVTHGTDLMEEVAFLCDLLYDGWPPVVFTGAMRIYSAPGADGLANLRDAIVLARDTAAPGMGVMVAFAGQVHAARHVRKADSTNVAAFASPQTGPVGYVDEDRFNLTWRPRRRGVLRPTGLDGRVEILTAALESDPAVVDAVAGLCDGIVVAVPGAGHTPPEFLAAIAAVASRMPVVAVARPWRGSILRDTYGFPGAEADLRASGVICAGALSAPAARVALIACLSAGLDTTQTKEMLDQYDL